METVTKNYFNLENPLERFLGDAKSGVDTLSSKLHIFLSKAWATITDVLPNSLKWSYRACVSREITSFKLQQTVSKTSTTANLYLHGDLNAQKQPALLLLHGDHGHPFTTLHLADKVMGSRPVFSLYMPFDGDYTEGSRALLKQSIDKIEALVSSNGKTFCGLVAVGHSKGAIQAAHQVFVEKYKRIQAVISIAGRLKVVPSVDKPCHETLKPIVNAIYEGIGRHPEIPLYQIIAEKDSIVPVEACIVRNHPSVCTLVPGALHLNVLYRPETIKAFCAYLGSG